MNKKVLALTLILLAIPIITIVPVYAGKGQEKLYFKLYMEGESIMFSEDRAWFSPTKELPPPDGDANLVHVRGLVWVITGDFYVVIGEDPPILLDPEDYSGSLDLNWNFKTLQMTLKVRETITIDGGTLEILSVDKIYNAGTPGMYGIGTFAGHGTGTLEGVKVKGTTSAVGITVTREGTVMGWPT